MAQRKIGVGHAYSLPIKVQQSATTAADATVWAMRNTVGTKDVFIEKIFGTVSFQGTAAANTLGYYLCRFSTATPSTGTALTVIKRDTDNSTSVVGDARFVDTGLTVTDIVFETAFHYINLPISVTGTVAAFNLDYRESPIVLASGEGLCLRLTAQAVIGLAVAGEVQWRETA